MLDIIMPHYDEPWEIGKPFFDMLACQRGVNFGQIRVILVNDGTGMVPAELFAGYPFQVEQHNIAHKGVSAARNFGMDMATAKWITFCDFDDRFSSVYSLKFVFDVLGTDDYDMLWNPFYVENYDKDGNFVLTTNDKYNMVWIHNKYFRRQAMKDHDLRFNEDLWFCEDSAMLAILNCEIPIERIGKIKSEMPLYVWVYREGSATLNKDLLLHNMIGHFSRNKYVVDNFLRSGHPDAEVMCGRTITDAYAALTRKDPPDGVEKLEKLVGDFMRKRISELRKLTQEDWKKVMRASVREAKGSGYLNAERPVFGEWLKEMREKYV